MLAECGVSAADVKTIFITHAHFDHVGALSRFPNATLYIQTRELEKWSWALTLGPEAKFLTDAVDPADIIKLAELARTNRLVCVDGDRQDVLPGIDLHLAADTHTFGSMYLTVRNGGENVWVLSGDIVYVYENMTGDDPQQRRYIPIGYASGSQENLILATDTLLKTAGGDPQRVVPFHESRLGDTYPSREVAAGLRIIEVALAKAEASRIG
jgi:glyoxylase-like metal-dependent hydrolase (beta-lactamase superfamily II)